MSVNYKPLWKLLVDNDMNKTDLRDAIHISNSTLAKLSKNEYVALSVLEKICKHFDCKIEEVVEIINDNNN